MYCKASHIKFYICRIGFTGKYVTLQHPFTLCYRLWLKYTFNQSYFPAPKQTGPMNPSEMRKFLPFSKNHLSRNITARNLVPHQKLLRENPQKEAEKIPAKEKNTPVREERTLAKRKGLVIRQKLCRAKVNTQEWHLNCYWCITYYCTKRLILLTLKYLVNLYFV